MRLICTVFLFLTSLFYGYGQQRGQLSGKLVDSVTRQSLALATITVFNASDTSIISYRMSDTRGDFRVTGIPLNLPARVIISYSGYRSIRREFTLTADSSELFMGTVAMVNSPESLEEVVIVAERPPVIVRNDTIEFNANSFKTLPTALVEDLLKKLPGVLVDAAGNVTVNGRRVNRILVDGKTFFGDDPKMATRNLPANLIDKVQVADDKEEIDRAIDGNLSDIGKVINLSLKKGVKKGWFGKIYGGAGTDERYELGGIANIFRDTMQLSILAFSNNVGRSGFSMKDVQDLGGFNRSGFNSIAIAGGSGGASGFALNGISFGGMEQGVARSSGAGLNFNHAPNSKKTMFAQYFYGQSRARVEELTRQQQFISDTILNTNSNINSVVVNATHNVNVGMRLRPDSVTNLNVNAGLAISENNRNAFSRLAIFNNRLGELSKGQGDRNNFTNDKSYNHDLRFTKRSRKKAGRVLDINHYLSYRDNIQQFLTEDLNIFFIPTTDTILFEQLRVQDVPTLNASVNVNYTEPLSKNLSLRITQNLRYIREKQLINTFGNSGTGKYEIAIPEFSDGFHRDQTRSSSGLALTYRWKGFNITAGAVAIVQDIRNEFVKTELRPNMSLFDILPSFSLSKKSFHLSYNENVIAPAINYMNPVTDNSNPYQIRLSNPNLKPMHSRSFYANYYSFLPKHSLNLSFYLNGNLTEDDIILARNIDSRGVQVSQPINANGSRDLSTSAGITKQFKNNTKFIFSTNARVRANTSRKMLMVNGKSGHSSSFTVGPSAGIGLNFNDIVEIRPEYRYSVNRTRYTDDFFRDLNIITHYLDGEVILRWPKRLVWETNYSYRRNSEVALGMPKDNFLWNAAVTALMMKEDRGQLRLSVYDILNRNNNFVRSSSQNFIVDQQTNILQRYFLLTFTYNIRTMGRQGKVGGRDRLFLF